MKPLRFIAIMTLLLFSAVMLTSCQRALPEETQMLGRVAPPGDEASESVAAAEDFRANYRLEDAHPIPMQFLFQPSLEALVGDTDAIILGRIVSISPRQSLSFSASGEGVTEMFQVEGYVNEVQALSVLKGQLMPGAMLEIRSCEAFLGSTLDAETLENIVYSAHERPVLRSEETYLFFLKQTGDDSLYMVNELQGAWEISGDMVRAPRASQILSSDAPLGSFINDIFEHMASPQPMLSHNRPFMVEDEAF